MHVFWEGVMNKQATLSAKLNHLILPIIIVPLLLSGCLAFWVYYQDADYRFDHYVNDRRKNIQSLSKAPAIEQYFISRQFSLTEEMDFYRDKITQLLAGYLEPSSATGSLYNTLVLADDQGFQIVQRSVTREPLKLPNAPSLAAYLPKINALPKDAVFETHNSVSMVQAVPLWVDLNSDGLVAENEFCGFILAQFGNPFMVFLGTAIKTGSITMIILVIATVCGLILIKGFIDKVTHPLTGLAMSVESIGDGHFEYYNPTGTTVEINHLAGSFNRMQAALQKSDIRIRRHIELLKSLTQSARRISSSLDLEAVLTFLSMGLTETLDCEQLHFVIISDDGETMLYRFKADADGGALKIEELTPETESFVLEFLRSNKTATVLARPVKDDFLPEAFPGLFPSNQLIGMPLRFLEKPIGAIWATIAAEQQPSEEVLDYLSSISSQAAISVKNAMLFQEITEVKNLLELDIIERERETREKEKLQAQLIQAYKMEAIGTLAGGIAHDFNNILSSIIGFTELAIDDAEKETILEDNLNQIFIAAQRARDLVRQILTFARQTDDELKPVRVDLIARETLKLLRSSLPATIRFKKNIRSRSLVMANATQVQQIFMNLCTNAAQAMESRGGVMEINMTDESLGMDSVHLPEPLEPGEYMKIEVIDSGTGIPENIIGSIFEPFFTTKAPGEGTGMGLSVVHGIVKKFGGHISVESELERRTIFTTFLPITPDQEEVRDLPNGAMLSGSERILVVDDDLQLLEMAGQSLRRLGYSVSTQSSSVAALRLFRAKPHDFDLVISDMTMPKMTGDDLAVELLKIRPDLPVIVLTGYSKKISEQLAADIGIKAFAYKPLIKRDLAEMVRRVLDEAMGKSVEAVADYVSKQRN